MGTRYVRLRSALGSESRCSEYTMQVEYLRLFWVAKSYLSYDPAEQCSDSHA